MMLPALRRCAAPCPHAAQPALTRPSCAAAVPPCPCPAPRQVYRVAQRSFLPKDWIMEQWDKGFYITGARGRGVIGGMGKDAGLSLLAGQGLLHHGWVG